MRKILTVFAVFIAVGMGGIAAGSATWLFWNVSKASDLEAFRALLGGFAGAFFAFLFIRLGDWLTRLYQRRATHYNALVRLQYYFNECLVLTGDNIFIADDFFRCFAEESREGEELRIFMNRFIAYPRDIELVISLSNIDYANELYSFNIEIQKTNQSMATVNRSYEQMLEAFVSKNIDASVYQANVHALRIHYVELRKFLLRIKHDLVLLIAKARLLDREAPWLFKVIRALTSTTYGKGFEKRVGVEATKVESEIEAVAKKSRDKIAEVRSKAVQ
ncbi:MAG: hypothetical protein H7X91_00555 [Burkholderiales bacterium]|nr:hypothetical protein [Burkholderiales bacterium]